MSPAQDTIEHGLLLEEKMEWAAAVEVYTALLPSVNGDQAELAFRLGHAHFHLSQFEQAAVYLQEATSLNPGKASWQYRLGYVLEQLGHFEAAVLAYQSSLALEPGQARRIERLRTATVSAERSLAASLEEQRSKQIHHRARVDELVAAKAPLWQQIEALSDGLTAPPGRSRLADPVG